MDIRLVLAATLGAYLAGSITFGLIVARLTGGPDPRSIGSGRTGGTNALRTQGKAFALGVVLWELCTGQRLFARDTDVATLRALTGDDPIAFATLSAHV